MKIPLNQIAIMTVAEAPKWMDAVTVLEALLKKSPVLRTVPENGVVKPI